MRGYQGMKVLVMYTHDSRLAIFSDEEVVTRPLPRWLPVRVIPRPKPVPARLDITIMIAPPNFTAEKASNFPA
jgi:hypothetical protein